MMLLNLIKWFKNKNQRLEAIVNQILYIVVAFTNIIVIVKKIDNLSLETRCSFVYVHSFEYCNADPTRDSFDEYYMPLVEIKDFNALVDNKPFLDQPVKENKQEAYEKLFEMSRKNDYTTETLLDYSYYQKY